MKRLGLMYIQNSIKDLVISFSLIWALDDFVTIGSVFIIFTEYLWALPHTVGL